MSTEDFDAGFEVMSPFMKVIVSPLRDVEGKTADESERLGQGCMNDGDFIGAEQHFKTAIEQGGRTADSLLNYGAALEATDQDEAAYDVLKESFELRADGQVVLALSDVSRKLGEREEALQWLMKGIQIEPETSFIYVRAAELHSQSGRRKEAAELMLKAAQVEESNADYWVMAAEMLFHAGRYDDALSSVKTAIEMQPGNSLNHQIESSILWKMGRQQEAVRAIRLAIDMSFDAKIYHGVLEYFLTESGFEEEAAQERQITEKFDRFEKDQVDRILHGLKSQ